MIVIALVLSYINNTNLFSRNVRQLITDYAYNAFDIIFLHSFPTSVSPASVNAVPHVTLRVLDSGRRVIRCTDRCASDGGWRGFEMGAGLQARHRRTLRHRSELLDGQRRGHAALAPTKLRAHAQPVFLTRA